MSRVEIKEENHKVTAFIDGKELKQCTGIDINFTPGSIPQFDFSVYASQSEISVDYARVTIEPIIPTLPLATSVVMEELRKHEDWYNTWVQMLSKCIEECNGQMTNEEIAKCYVDNYLLGSD